MRFGGRKNDELRPVKIIPGYVETPAGSALIEMGRTKILCTASIQARVPPWLHHAQIDEEVKIGWITAEYSILPGATPARTNREATMGRQGGRTLEIQRMIGRSFRAVIPLEQLGPRTIWVDCDVIQADGGTRTAAITGGFVALVQALRHLQKQGIVDKVVIKEYVAAVSVGLLGQDILVDLDAQEDKRVDVDCNIVMTESGQLIEIQGAAEKNSFSPEQLMTMLRSARGAVQKLVGLQRTALG